jgi:ParB family chromosome partitioning protein
MGALDMARKDLLKGLMTPPDANSAQPSTPAQRPTYTKGAIGAVSRSISELKSRSITEIPTDLIDDTGGLKDRLGEDVADQTALIDSIRDYGQQVPVLLRHDPNNEGRYQIVYGRRRVAALRALGQPVKALLRELNDQDLIVAQGQENAARRDLTFIEKANFARQMRDAHYERKLICAALHIDKTVISRMLNVADTLGGDVIRAIGPAPSVGRDRWLRLVALVESGTSPKTLLKTLEGLSDLSSDARFDALLITPTKTKSKPAAPAPLLVDGKPLGQISHSAKTVTLTLDEQGFGDWIAKNIEEFHRAWTGSKGRRIALTGGAKPEQQQRGTKGQRKSPPR